jgi:hypothetical protein
VSLSFEDFAATYKTLLETPQPSSGATAGRKPSVGPGSKSTAGKTAATPSAKDLVLRYLSEHFESESEFQVGKNRVFLRTPAVKTLEESKTTATTHCVNKFQALARRHLAQRRFKTMRGMVIVLQAKVRMFLKRRKYKREMAEKVEERLRAHRTVAQRNQVTAIMLMMMLCSGKGLFCDSHDPLTTWCLHHYFPYYTLCHNDLNAAYVLTLLSTGGQRVRAAGTGFAQRLYRGGVHQS